MENKKISMSIQKIMIITILSGIILSTVFIGVIVFSNWISSIDQITKDISAKANQEISEQINSYLNVPKHINDVNERLIENEIVDMEDETERVKYFAGVLQTHKDEIYSFTFGLENGEYYGARRNDFGGLEIVKNNSDTNGESWYYSVNDKLESVDVVLKTDKYDVRTREWYMNAKAAGEFTFSSIYKHFIMDDLAISATTPIQDQNGNLVGILGTHMILSSINEYTKAIVAKYNGYALVLEKDTDYVIANSFDSDNFVIESDGTLKRNTINELKNDLMTDAYQKFNSSNENNFEIIGPKGGYYVNVYHYENEGLDWIIISAIPNNIFLGEINNNITITAIIILVSSLVVSIMCLLIIRWIFTPIRELILASKEIANGNLGRRAIIKRHDEIGNLSSAFNFMADSMSQIVNHLEEKVKERTVELESTNDELNKTKEDLYLILDTTAEGIFGIDMEGNFIFCNNSCLHLLGYKEQSDFLGKNMFHMLQPSNGEGILIDIEHCKILKSLSVVERVYAADEAFKKADGTLLEVEYHSYPKLKDGIVMGSVVTFIDITDKKKDEEQIKYLSCHDSLTGLMNRRCFETNLQKIDTDASLPISIIFGDLNGLKLTNDIFGHAAGDKLIQKTAQVLERVCRADDLVARVGGDEFIIILPKTDANLASGVMQRIKNELTKETVYALKCNMAMGFDTKTQKDQNLEKIMGNAESKMYKEKLSSKKNYGIDTIQTIINTLQSRNPEEKGHSERVAQLCEDMGRKLNLSEREIKRLKDAGYIHDIGKIVLEEELLRKDNLFDDEMRLKQQHPVVGYRILNLFDDTLDLSEAVYSHHEHWDGSGFPKGLKGEEIPLISRIIAITERYDKLMIKSNLDETDRQKNALDEIVNQSGISFDPDLTKMFVNMVQKSTI